MDITAFVGIIGAVIGGTIGLMGQRLNVQEQRRKDRLERVADLLRAADEVNTVARTFMWDLRTDNLAAADRHMHDLFAAIIDVRHKAQYLHLTAPWALRRWVTQLSDAVNALYDAAVKMLDDADQLNDIIDENWTEEESDEVLGAALKKVHTEALANYESLYPEYELKREGLLKHLQPNLGIGPWWTRRPAVFWAKRK